jgi:hypothetical protein
MNTCTNMKFCILNYLEPHHALRMVWYFLARVFLNSYWNFKETVYRFCCCRWDDLKSSLIQLQGDISNRWSSDVHWYKSGPMNNSNHQIARQINTEPLKYPSEILMQILIKSNSYFTHLISTMSIETPPFHLLHLVIIRSHVINLT